MFEQCASVGWTLLDIEIPKVRGAWVCNGCSFKRPEEAVAENFGQAGAQVSWCEGGSVNLLMKAASLDWLSQNVRRFGNPVTNYFEAQCKAHEARAHEIVDAIRSSDKARTLANIDTLAADETLRRYYPRVTAEFMKALHGHVNTGLLGEIAELFVQSPYDYRSGWPDLIVLDGGELRFVEVKTTDFMHASQLRFAREVAAPLQLDCEVIRVIAS